MLDLCNVDSFEHLSDIECAKWLKKLNYRPKLRTYKQFWIFKESKNYVNMNLSSNERSKAAQFRMGTLPIHIETGRYRNKNEMHFEFHCPLYGPQIDELYSYICQKGENILCPILTNLKRFLLNFQDSFQNIFVKHIFREVPCYMTLNLFYCIMLTLSCIMYLMLE